MRWFFPFMFMALAQASTTILEDVNRIRELHRAPPLRWDSDMASFAYAWSDYLVNQGLFIHSRSAYGENLALIGIGRTGCDEAKVMRIALQLWAAERALLKAAPVAYNASTGHFTALVWKGSRRVGAGVACNPARRRAVAMMVFHPPGNVAGRFRANVEL